VGGAGGDVTSHLYLHTRFSCLQSSFRAVSEQFQSSLEQFQSDLNCGFDDGYVPFEW